MISLCERVVYKYVRLQDPIKYLVPLPLSTFSIKKAALTYMFENHGGLC